MDTSTTEGNTSSSNRITIEALSKEEIINKYKSLLNIAKKAKQAKDEAVEENLKLKEVLSKSETQKEADKKALITMKEMLEQFTEDKLELTIRISEFERQSRISKDAMTQLNIENESLQRQIERLTEENDNLLSDIDKMEEKLKQVNLIGIEQRKHITLLEPEVNKLKEYESQVACLQNDLTILQTEKQALHDDMTTSFEYLQAKYKKVKEINSEQCKKFNYLKERFMDVYGKLKRLKECKCSLLETQQEYYENVSKWQNDIQKASILLCSQITHLSQENNNLKKNQHQQCSPNDTNTSLNNYIDTLIIKLNELHELTEKVVDDYKEQSLQLEKTLKENEDLRLVLSNENEKASINAKLNNQSLQLQQELKDLKVISKENEEKLKQLKEEKFELDESFKALENDNILLKEQNQILKKLKDDFLQKEKNCNEEIDALQKSLNEKGIEALLVKENKISKTSFKHNENYNPDSGLKEKSQDTAIILVEKDSIILQLRAENLALKDSIEALEENQSVLKKEILALQTNVSNNNIREQSVLESNIGTLQSSMRALEDQLEYLKNENIFLRQSVKDHEISEVLLKENNEVLRENMKALETKQENAQVSQTNTKMDDLKSQDPSLALENESLKQNLNEALILKEEINVLKNSLADLKVHNVLLKEENNVLKNNLYDIEMQCTIPTTSNVNSPKNSAKDFQNLEDLLKEENEVLKKSLKKIEQEENLLKEEIEGLRNSLKDIEAHETILREENFALNLSKENLEAKESALKEEIRTLLNSVKDLEEQKSILKQENEALELSKQAFEDQELLLKQELDVVRNSLENLENKESLLREENVGYKEELNELLSDANILKQDLANVSDQLAKQTAISQKLQEQLTTLEVEKASVLRQLANQREHLEDDKTEELLTLRQSYEDIEARYALKEREHTDLLDEMRELNEVLKTRGDVISRQQEKHQELTNEIKKVTAKLKDYEQQTKDKLHELNLISSQNKERLEEIAALSSQTKKKDEEITLLNTEIASLKNIIREMQESLRINEENYKIRIEELHSLKNASFAVAASASNETDNQSELLSIASGLSKADEMNRLRDLEDSFEEKYNKMRTLALKLKKKLQEQTLALSEMEKQLNKHEDTEDDLKASHEQLQKQIDTLKGENQKLKLSRKQTNVLNLEIEAAEKSLNEISSKLSVKAAELENLKGIATSQENTIKQLKEEISFLESAKQSEIVHSKDLKAQIDLLQNQIKDVLHEKQASLLATKELEQSVEHLKLETKDLKLQLSSGTSKHEEALFIIQQEKQKLSAQLAEDQNLIQTLQANLKSTERSLEDLRVEYIEYKVKAQVVLRKNQTKDSFKEREMEEELLSLRQAEEKWNQLAKDYIQKIENSDRQIDSLTETNSSLQNRIQDLVNIIEDLRQQYETLSLENQKLLQIEQETVKEHRQRIEQMDSCYKLQLQELESKYQEQLEQVKAEHAKSLRLTPIIGPCLSSTSSITANHLTKFTTDQSKIDFLLMEREDAEGSEEAVEALASNRKISNASRRSHHDFMPLDELLNAPMHLINDTVTTITTQKSLSLHSEETIDNTHSELQATKERLHIQESRVRHLTALLSENEQDLAKLTQMNDMLKEELRRQERSAEREKHMHNAEYLKNVILKFLTLNNTDERIRLVPVLNTILRLSKTETEMLNNVAKGQKGTSERSWSSLLSSWTGANTGHYPNFSNVPPNNNN